MKKENDKKDAPCPSCKGEGAIFINLPRDK